MKLSRAQRILFTGLAAVGVTAGAAGLASAATATSTPSPTVAVAQQGTADAPEAGDTADVGNSATVDAPEAGDTADSANEADEAPGYTSSITVADGADTGTENDSAETAQLAGLAKINAAQAKEAAVVAVPGTPAVPVLENENGNVVYSVSVSTTSGIIDVKVDAGNGQVLAQDHGDSNESDGEAKDSKDGNDAETNDAPQTTVAPATNGAAGR